MVRNFCSGLKVLSEVARLVLVAVSEHHAELLESVLGLSELVSSLQKKKRGMDLAYDDLHGQF